MNTLKNVTQAIVRLSVSFLAIIAGLWLLNGIWYA